MTAFATLVGTETSIEYQGKEYFFSPLTLRDFGACVVFYQYKELREHQTLKEVLDPQIYLEQQREIVKKCQDKKYIDSSGKSYPLSWEIPEVQEFFNTHYGVAYQCYLCLKHRHPEMTEELADKIVTVNHYIEVLQKILSIQGLISGEEDEAVEGEAKPNQ